MGRVVVVEDERDILDLMVLHLGRAGHEAVGVENGEEALRLLREDRFDLGVFDWMLPGISGLELCKGARQKMPVLMVTARASSSDIIHGLEAGADDYVTKPFEIGVFLARVNALLRRPQARLPAETYRWGDLVLETGSRRVILFGEDIPLTPSEYKLLLALVQNQGRVLSRKQLIELVHGPGIAVVDRAVDTIVFGLRHKLGVMSSLVETVRAVGYRIRTHEPGTPRPVTGAA